ncbi:DNA primase [Thalassobacillus sp. CUG 92003]|uniref:DNA primase n=1 Tax=Thalassobacillus sp. CUG 92003 TaxID=2736641 RepID=UPI00351A08C0
MKMNGRIPEETVEDIRKATNIVDIVGEYVQLKKQGRNYFGLCPFHGENTPSFSVSSDKQIFHCFGCGKGGNVFTFLMEVEGYAFSQAVQQLAEAAGYSLPESATDKTPQQSSEAQSILEAHQWLEKLYHHLLRHSKEGKAGYQYLLERGFTEETIERFQLGYAPQSKDFVVKFLEKKGFHPQTMVKAGLLNVNDEGEYADRFRGRIIFPIHNHHGKTVAFGGRALYDHDPKYLNSPETELFHKGKLLYNFDLARAAIRRNQSAVLFEGYVDVISAYQAGVENGVGTLGTAISDVQAKLLHRYVEHVIICYDGDEAGLEATIKAARLLKRTGCQVKVARLPDGMDPDDYIQSYGAERFRQEVIEAHTPYMTFVMNYLKRDYNLQLEGDRIDYIEKVLQELADLDRGIEREHYLTEVANEFDMSLETLRQEVQELRRSKAPAKDNSRAVRHTNTKTAIHLQDKLLPAFQNAERKLIAHMLRDPHIADKVQDEIGGNFNIDQHQVIVTYLYAYYEEGNFSDTAQFVERLSDPDLKNLVVQLAMMPVLDEISDQEINDYIYTIQAEQSNKHDIQSLKAEQKKAEQQNEPIRAAEIAMEILQLKQQMKQS